MPGSGAAARGRSGGSPAVDPEARGGRRVALELGPPVHLPTMTWLPLKDFLDQLGHAIVLSHLGPTANIPP